MHPMDASECEWCQQCLKEAGEIPDYIYVRNFHEPLEEALTPEQIEIEAPTDE